MTLIQVNKNQINEKMLILSQKNTLNQVIT